MNEVNSFYNNLQIYFSNSKTPNSQDSNDNY